MSMMLAKKKMMMAMTRRRLLKISDVFEIVGDTAANLDSEDLTDWDLVIAKSRVNTTNWVWRDRLAGFSSYLSSNTTADYAAFSDYATLLGSGNAILYKLKERDKFLALRSFAHTNGVASTVTLSGFGAIGLVYVRQVGASGDWRMWHRSLTAGNNMRLNASAAQTTSDAHISVSGETITFASSAPTGSYIVMAFAHNPGVIWCDAYTGNGLEAGPSVNLGARPGFIHIKNRDAAFVHLWHDEQRGFPPAGNSPWLFPESTAAEAATIPSVEVSSSGFEIVTANATWNGDTNAMIYVAMATLT